MTTAEILAVLAQECPNGVSFDPMAVRLLRQKVPFEDLQIEDLKAAMFQLGSGLWFSREMISDDESRLAFEEQAMEWLMDHGCFSVERLFERLLRCFPPYCHAGGLCSFSEAFRFYGRCMGKGRLFLFPAPT